MRLSKSRYCAGLQCHRQLWWRSHEPGAPELEPDASLEAIFNQGHVVGLAAQERFPGGVLIDFPFRAYAERLAATQVAIETKAPAISEASVMADDVFVAVDILERVPGGWTLVEVKSTTQVKEPHIPDIAVQLHVLRASGLKVDRAELMHLNRECTFPNLDDLFLREDVTTRAEALLAGIPAEVRNQLDMLNGPIPEVPIGPHCTSPYDCPFMERCWPERPEHHVSKLYSIGRGWEQLEADGYTTIDQLPEGLKLRNEAERQRRAVTSGTMIVEPGLAEALRAFKEPVAILDFETLAPAVPVWPGCHPYDPVPAQFSVHVHEGAGTWRHHEWLANLDIANSLRLLLAGDKQTPIGCMVGNFKAVNGDFIVQDLVLDTPKVNVTGSGDINFIDESLHIRLVSRSKGFSLASLRGPVNIAGTFKNPAVRPELGGAIIRGGLAAALGAATAGRAGARYRDY